MVRLSNETFSVERILDDLKARANPDNLKAMQRFRLVSEGTTLGISIHFLRAYAKSIKPDNVLANKLWNTGIKEARILAVYLSNPSQVNEEQMDRWASDFDTWDLCDQCCCNLFDRTAFAWQKAVQWSKHEKEFVKRAAFVLMACLAVHDKYSANDKFERFFPLMEKHAADERNFVKKAVNWALRQLGKRNLYLNKKAIATALEIQKQNSGSAKWIAADALRELKQKKKCTSKKRKEKIK